MGILLFAGRARAIVNVTGGTSLSQTPSPVGQLPTVLLVDSHEDSRLIYTAALRHHGLGVLATDSPLSGLTLALRERPSVVVLELSVTGSQAWDAIASFRGDANRGVPVLGLSSTGLPEHRERALRLGCAAVLVKPLGPLELIAQVRRLLDG